MARDSASYLRFLQSLLPRGKAWSRAIAARLTQYLHAQADELARIDTRVDDLMRERSVLLSNELISDHEKDLGLPDDCTRNYSLTLSERRIAAHTKLIATGQQDKAYFIKIANSYGYEAEIEEYSPFWCGLMGCGDPIGDIDNIFYWKITVYTDETAILFLCGVGACGDPLQKVSDLINTIFCFARKYKPAHTILLTALVGAGFDAGFSVGFDALPSEIVDYLHGSFSQGFSFGFYVNLGGAFANGFDAGFDKPA